MSTTEKKQVITRLGPPTAPWAMQTVTRGGVTRFEPVHKGRFVPWAPVIKEGEPPEGNLLHPADLDYLGPIPFVPEPPAPETPIKNKAVARRRPPANPRRLICAWNYVAVDPDDKLFGVIDTGLGARSLIVHVRRNRVAWQTLNALRPGAILRVRPVKGTEVVDLRVRYTTPCQYYSPGEKVSTLTIGVDEMDWRSFLMAVAPRI